MANLSFSHKCFNDMPKILYQSRDWHRVQQQRHPMATVISAAYMLADARNYAQLALEWPYMSDTDVTRIAYTADDRAAEADRQTLTTVGKYLKRHFPTLPDHTIRDLVAKYATASEFSISNDPEAIVNAVQDGPPSCMQWSEEQVDEAGCHPYEVYAPKFGWSMAMRKDGRQINGRALVMQRMKNGTEVKYFVRTYQRPSDTCSRYSAPDEQLHQWLESQGYERRNSWKGERLAYMHSNLRDMDFVAPYIDGGAQCVDAVNSNGENCLVITDDGEYECCSTNGGYEAKNSCTCEDCNRRIDEDDTYSVGYHGDTTVGPCCIDNYTRVTGRRGETYYVPEDDAVECDGEWYDRDHLSEHGIVQLHDGEYAQMDDTVFIESQGEHYRSDDEDIVEDHNNEWQMRDDCVELENGDWALEDDTWCCEVSGEYYLTDNDDPVVIHGLNFHADTSAEDIAEAINDKTGQKNLFVQQNVVLVSEAERAEAMSTIVVAPEPVEQEFLMRGQSGTTHMVKESRVQHFKDLQWVLVDTVAEFLIPAPEPEPEPVVEDKVLMIDPNYNRLVNAARSSVSYFIRAGWIEVTEDHCVKFVRMEWRGSFYDVTPNQVTQNEAAGWTISEPVPPTLTREGYNGWLWAERGGITSPNGSWHCVTPHVANIYANLFGFTTNVTTATTETI